MAGSRFDVIVVGEGIAGLTAAGLAARAGLRVASLEASFPGGMVANIIELDPAPHGPASGADLAGELVLANSTAGVKSINASAERILALQDGSWQVVTAVEKFGASAVILATGARLRPLGVANEAAYLGRGLSTCADCDGPFFQGEDVVVVGGGDSALQEALVLAQICRKVVIVHDRADFSASDAFVKRALATPNIAAHPNSRVTAIEGEDGVEAVQVFSSSGVEPVTRIPCRGVFPYIGLLPAIEALPVGAAMDELGGVRTGGTLETSMPNLWAIGAVRAGFPGRIADAIQDAEIAVRELVSRRVAKLGGLTRA